MKSALQTILVSVSLLLSAAFAPQASAASFSDEQKAVHKCVGETSLPWSVSVADGAPEAYKPWLGQWVGAWNDNLCHMMIVSEIENDGRVYFLYSIGAPHNVYYKMEGKIVDEDGRQVLHSKFQSGWTLSYTLAPTGVLLGNFKGSAAATMQVLPK